MTLPQIHLCLADETRLRIVNLLLRGPLCVCHFQGLLGLPQVQISKHLRYLRVKGLVTARRHRQWMIYSLPLASVELRPHFQCLHECAQTHPTLAADLRRLQKSLPDVAWISDLARTPAIPCCPEPAQ